jgi:hypothetical protein
MKLLLAGVLGLLAASPVPCDAQPKPGSYTTESYSALALAALVGMHSPALKRSERAALSGLLRGRLRPGGMIDVSVDAVDCRAGDVDIAAFACELHFGARKVTLVGRPANELFATMQEAGVPADGATGTVHEAVSALACAINPAEIARKDGGGAKCAFNTALGSGATPASD